MHALVVVILQKKPKTLPRRPLNEPQRSILPAFFCLNFLCLLILFSAIEILVLFYRLLMGILVKKDQQITKNRLLEIQPVDFL